MAPQSPIPAQPYRGLHPLSINGWALLEFDQQISVQLTELERQFYQPRHFAYARLDMPERPPMPKPR